ncbi:YcaO-like family protein [Desulfonauticus submarinus]
MLTYLLNLKKVKNGIGFYFTQPNLNLKALFAYLEKHPLDLFAHKYLLEELQIKKINELENFFNSLPDSDLKNLLIKELVFLSPNIANILKSTQKAKTFPSPLILSKIISMEDHDLHQQWINYLKFRQDKPQEQANIPKKFPKIRQANKLHNKSSLQTLPLIKKDSSFDFNTLNSIYENLKKLHLFKSSEYQHKNGLAPVNLWRKWVFQRKIKTRFLEYVFKGEQISFGRGFNFDQARIRLYMEMVERFSAYAQIEEEHLTNLLKPQKLVFDSYSSLKNKKFNLLDPNSLALDAPYLDEKIFWLKGKISLPEKNQDILIPAQLVFLFFNPGEISLMSNLGSTGLAAGINQDQAKLNALLEIIERDSETLSLYDEKNIFQVDFNGSFFENFQQKLLQSEIFVYFQDLSHIHNIPCFKAFVLDKHNNVIKGTAANLNPILALINALTEIPYSLTDEPSQKLNAPLKKWTDFQNFSTSNPTQDLTILEEHLFKQNIYPLYVDLTHKDLKIPVVRAILPGLEPLADFDFTSRLRPRLIAALKKDMKSG